MRASLRLLSLILLLPSCAAGSLDGDTDGSATATTSTTTSGGGHGGGTTSSATTTTTGTSSTGTGGVATTTTTSSGSSTGGSGGTGGVSTTTTTSSTSGSGGAATTTTTTSSSSSSTGGSGGAGGATTTTTTTGGTGGAATTTTTSSTSTSTGPADIGLYAYAPVPAPGLVNPPSAAWHPDGTYALVLNTANKVYRYDPATKSLSEVAAAGATISWRSVTFTPDGTQAILLGNVNPPTEEGRIYLWDSATSTLSEMPNTAQPQITYEAVEWSPDKSTARLLGAKKNGSTWLACLWNFDPATGLSNLKASATSAMCQDLAWATDSFDRPAVAVTCGGNGVTLFHVDFDGQIVNYNGNAGNTSHIAGRPQGDYALAVGWSGQRVYRFQQGGWDTDFGNPTLPGIYQVQFSTDGRRALVLGGFGKIYEFRHDLMQQGDFTDASIPNFASPPYNAESQVTLNDVAWRPGCEGGILVGGANTWSVQKGYVIRFSIQNGVACPN